MPIRDGGENACHRVIVKLVDGDDVEMSREAAGDVVSTTTWWSHGSDKQLEKKTTERSSLCRDHHKVIAIKMLRLSQRQVLD